MVHISQCCVALIIIFCNPLDVWPLGYTALLCQYLAYAYVIIYVMQQLQLTDMQVPVCIQFVWGFLAATESCTLVLTFAGDPQLRIPSIQGTCIHFIDLHQMPIGTIEF